MKEEIKSIVEDIQFLEDVYRNLIAMLPSFDITNKKILPYGLKPHTHSVSWIVEQIITQQTK